VCVQNSTLYTMIVDHGVFYDVLHLKWPPNIRCSIT